MVRTTSNEASAAARVSVPAVCGGTPFPLFRAVRIPLAIRVFVDHPLLHADPMPRRHPFRPFCLVGRTGQIKFRNLPLLDNPTSSVNGSVQEASIQDISQIHSYATLNAETWGIAAPDQDHLVFCVIFFYRNRSRLLSKVRLSCRPSACSPSDCNNVKRTPILYLLAGSLVLSAADWREEQRQQIINYLEDQTHQARAQRRPASPQAIAKLPGLSSHGREQATLSGDQLPVQFPDGLTARARLYRAAQPSRLAIVIPPPPSIRKRSPAPALPSPSSIPYRATPSIRSAANSKTSMRAGFSTARPDSSAKLCPASKPLRPPPPRYRSTSTAVGPPC